MRTTCVSAPVVFYEDAYENAPGESVARRATQTVLTVSADGGADGALLYVTAENIGNLACVGGALPAFPYTRMLAPNEHVDLTAVCEPKQYSGAENDIRVRAQIKPAGGGDVRASSASATAVLVQVTPVVTLNDAVRHRHRVGIAELVSIQHAPTLPMNWTATVGILKQQSTAFAYYNCPLSAAFSELTVRCHDVSYSTRLSVIEPDGLRCGTISAIDFGLPKNTSGGVGLSLETYVTPETVSFGGLAMEEIPVETGMVSGYFLNEEFSGEWGHTREHGAGDWQDIGNDNLFLHPDEAVMRGCLPPMTADGTLTNDVAFGWKSGSIQWSIPIGWNVHGTAGEMPPLKQMAFVCTQTFLLSPDGTLTVRKLGHAATRGTNAVVTLDGEIQ